jgi:hypothetical protein
MTDGPNVEGWDAREQRFREDWILGPEGEGVPTIALDPSSDRARQLALKAEQYERRLQTHTERGEHELMLQYKIRLGILGALFVYGSIDLAQAVRASGEASEPLDSSLREDAAFACLERADNLHVTGEEIGREVMEQTTQAFGIIADYVGTGGANNIGGGLPPVPPNPEV